MALSILIGLLNGITGESSDTSAVADVEQEPIVVDSLELKRLDSIVQSIEKRHRSGRVSLQSFKKKTDEFNGSSFYRDKRTPKYTNIDFIYPYIGESKGKYFIRLKMQYEAEDWLFIEGSTFLVDGQKFEVGARWDRDNSAGQIWEYADISVGEMELALLSAIADSRVTKVRYTGNQYHDDRTLTKKEKSIMRKTVDTYWDLTAN